MKRKAVVAALMMALIMLFTQMSFAMQAPMDGALMTTAGSGSGLEITKIVPKDGEKGKQIANMAVKIAFNEAVTNTANDLKNGKCVKITGADGSVVNFTVAHHAKYPNELWLIVDGDLVTNTVYTVEISAGIVADSGNTLAAGATTTFQTRNTKTDSTISFVLMIAMIGIMVLVTTKSAKKTAAENGLTPRNASNSISYNPYKLAKEQGISVDEAKEMIAKEKDKVAKKLESASKAQEKKKETDAAFEAEVAKRAEEIYQKGIKHVHAPGGVKARGYKVPKAVEKKIQGYVRRAGKR